LDATATLRTEIPRLLDEPAARSVLDIPGGDFGWLSQTRLGACRYIGADIVDELVERNTRLSAETRSDRRFMRLALTAAPLPRVDVLLCRDCLVRLSFQNIFRAFANLRRSGSRYAGSPSWRRISCWTIRRSSSKNRPIGRVPCRTRPGTR